MLYYLTAVIYVLVCLVLMLVILLQQGKGGDIANAFGGGTSQAAFGARSGATVLSRATTIAAVLFILGALALGIIGQRGPGSVVGGRAPQTAPLRPAAQPSPVQTVPGAPGAPEPGQAAPQQPAAQPPAQQQPTPAP
jgi:preprotein translocase subunit SecG